MLETLFFGTSTFAVPSMHVTAAKTRLRAVVTQPDRPAGRGHRLAASPIKRAALDLGIHVWTPLRLADFAREIQGEAFDLFVLAAYGRILPQTLLDIPRLGALNVHPSLLPKYRGATPIQAALRNGDSETGVTIMLMDAGLDTGDVVLQERVAIEPAENYGELHDRLALIGAELLDRALDLAQRGALTRSPQRGEPSVTKPIAPDELFIDWDWEPQRIVNFVRAYSPQPGARARVDGRVLKILGAHVAGDGSLEIDRVVAPNRGKMTWAQYRQSAGDP
jgi:methionyl-tRNA formyltransferase